MVYLFVCNYVYILSLFYIIVKEKTIYIINNLYNYIIIVDSNIYIYSLILFIPYLY